MNRTIDSLRSDEIFGAVTTVLTADAAGLPFPFATRRQPTGKAPKPKPKPAATTKPAETSTPPELKRGGTPEFGRNEHL